MSSWIYGGATFSADRKFRHYLWRAKQEELIPERPRRRLGACMLNPSEAGEIPIVEDDPTVRKVCGFADRFGFGRVDVANMSDYCATDPCDLYAAGMPISRECDSWIRNIALETDLFLVAWGALAKPVARARARQVLDLLATIGVQPYCIALTGGGDPWHPLMAKYTNAPILFVPRAASGKSGEAA